MENEELFTIDFLKSLSNWQNGWFENQENRRLIADELVKQCEKLPQEFKIVESYCYRKRFIIDGEIVPLLVDDEFFEGIASWSEELDYTKRFKGVYRSSSKFVMLFKHKPMPEEIVVNIVSLWKDDRFILAAENFQKEYAEEAKALFNFNDSQSEIVLKSTLKGTEIEDIVGISSSFDEICDMANIPEDKREEFSIQYARNPSGLPIEMPTFAGSKPTKEAINKVLNKFKETLEIAQINNIMVDWSRAAKPHRDDLKHKPKKS